jgi:hypothetical protein
MNMFLAVFGVGLLAIILVLMIKEYDGSENWLSYSSDGECRFPARRKIEKPMRDSAGVRSTPRTQRREMQFTMFPYTRCKWYFRLPCFTMYSRKKGRFCYATRFKD